MKRSESTVTTSAQAHIQEFFKNRDYIVNIFYCLINITCEQLTDWATGV